MIAVTYYARQTFDGQVTSIMRLTITDTTLDLDRYSKGQWVSEPDRISSLSDDMNVDQIDAVLAMKLCAEQDAEALTAAAVPAAPPKLVKTPQQWMDEFLSSVSYENQPTAAEAEAWDMPDLDD